MWGCTISCGYLLLNIRASQKVMRMLLSSYVIIRLLCFKVLRMKAVALNSMSKQYFMFEMCTAIKTTLTEWTVY